MSESNYVTTDVNISPLILARHKIHNPSKLLLLNTQQESNKKLEKSRNNFFFCWRHSSTSSMFLLFWSYFFSFVPIIKRCIPLSKWYKFICAITVNIGQDIIWLGILWLSKRNGCYNHLIHVLFTVIVLLLKSVNIFNLNNIFN